MSWGLWIGDDSDHLTLYDGGEVIAAVTAALMASGQHAKEAHEGAREVWALVSDGQLLPCKRGLPDGRWLEVRDNSPVPDHGKQCDGIDGELNRCGRYLNHPGSC